MIDSSLAFLISGAGYGISLMVLILISVIIWMLSLAIQRDE